MMNHGQVFLGCALALGMAGVAGAACPELSGRFQAAIDGEDVGAATRAFESIDRADECAGHEIKYAKYMLSDLEARELEGQVERRVAAGDPRVRVIEEFAGRIEQLALPPAGWRALSLAAEAALVAGEHDRAAGLLQRAVEILDNTLLTPVPPAAERIERVVRMGEQADLLAPSFAGRGMASRAPRGYKARSVITPVTFHYDSDEPTAKGYRAVEDILVRIREEPRVVIHGHTDPVGGDSYNQSLSERRAKRVAALLREKGYRGHIRSQGHGRSRPLVIENRDYFSDQEICLILRRVEIQLDDSIEPPFRYAPADTYHHLPCR